MTAVLVIAISGSSGAAGAPTPSADSRAQGSDSLRVTAPEKCPSARKGLRWYRGRYAEHRAKMGAGEARRGSQYPASKGAGDWSPTGEARSTCPRTRYLAKRWRAKAYAARVAAERWHERLTRRLEEAEFAICYVFGDYCSQALRVAECESGKSRNAHNGQYLGIFQMGSYARARYGHGDTFLAQARAAHHYFVASGRDWSPWSCKP